MLRGLYLSPNFDFLRIQVKECVQSELNESNPNWKATCANKEIVQQFLQQNGNFRVSLYHNNFLISPDKKESYAEAYLNEDLSFLFIPNQMFKSVDVFFRDYNIQTTTYGLFTSSVNKESFIVQEYKDFTESTVLGRKDEIYTELFLRRSPFTQNFKRQHETFIQFLSSFGGFINILVTCIGLFMRKYNYFQFTVELANKLYNFKFFNFNKKNSLVESENVSNTNTFNQNTQTKQDTLKCSVAKLTHSKINPNIVNNVNQVESPSKLSHKSSRAVEDIYKIVESPQISFQKAPSSNDITKSNNFLSVKSPQLTSINKINNQKYQQHASFNRLFLREINERNQVTVQSTRKKIWKVVKLINSPGFNYQEYEKKKTKSFITSAIKLREQLQNYKQLGYQNKADFLFNSFKQLIRQQQQKISVSFSYFFRFFRFNYSQNMMLLKARSNVSQDLDIYTILQKLQEVEKIKRILFNKEQNILFSFCPKPVIQYIPPISSQSTTPLSQPASQDTQNQQNQNLFQKNADFDDIDTYQKLYLAFDKIKSKEKKTGLQILIKELGGEINEIFDLSRELIRENEEVQKQTDSFENVFQKIGNSTRKVSTFKQQKNGLQSQLQLNQSNLNSGFNSINQLKLKDEPNDASIINQKTVLNDESYNKSTVQPLMNLSFFDSENKSGLAVFDTIPDIPFEPVSENNINKEEFQKQTVLKKLV